MQGLMMDVPLLISSLIRHADRHHGDTEIVSRTVEGGIHRYNYGDAHRRARKLSGRFAQDVDALRLQRPQVIQSAWD